MCGRSQGVVVRPFAAGDCAPACSLTNTFIRETTVHFGDQEETEETWLGVFSEQAVILGWPWVTAEIGGTFAGYAKSGVWRARAAYQKTAEVAVYVEPNARRRGVARALYAELFGTLSEKGCRTVIAGVTLPNEASVGLHESMGFTHVGTFREVGYKLGGWRDVGFWQLML